MKAFHEARTSKRPKRDLHVYWNQMHTHMRETGLKAEEEEELQQREKALKK
jgi:hypothetical protein